MSFITFEGIEGSGKSTQMELLKGFLEERGRQVAAIREPGGTALGEKMRRILVGEAGDGIAPWAELFLYEACRAQVVTEVIRPALEAGATVICDRYIDSTVAYQGYGRGLDIGFIRSVNERATGGVSPEITLLLDMDPEAGLERAWSRISGGTGAKEDRFEREDILFHKRVRAGFLRIAEEEPERVVIIDGMKKISSIHRDICDIIEKTGS